MNPSSLRPRASTCVVAIIVCCLATGGTSPPSVLAATSTQGREGQTRGGVLATLGDLSGSLETVVRTVDAAVVQILTTSYAPGEGLVPRTADLITTQRGNGSGVIVDPDGYVVTNAHVVRGAWRIRVELPTEPMGQSILAIRSRVVGAQLVGLDAETDIAVLKIQERNLKALPFGDSDELKAGQIVLAFGSPLGMQNSVSLGIVSAVARQLEPESPMVYVQTDASINPGNSGGPLVDVRGRLMGINTLVLSRPGGTESLGFAAPSNIVRAVFEQIRKTGRVRRGEIGIRAQTVTPVLAAGLGLAREHGVVLADVAPGSPAARAGLAVGDLVLTLNGRPMENGRQFRINLYRHAVGEVVTLEILREGKMLEVPVTMAERDDPLDVLSAVADPRENLVPRLGILGLTLDARIAHLLPSIRVPSGVVVASTVAGAIDSREGGFAPGDVIHAVNRQRVAGLTDLHKILAAVKVGDPVVVQLERDGEFMYLAFTVE